MKEQLLIFAWMIAVVNAGRGEWNAFGSYQYFVSGKGDIKSYVYGEIFCKNNSGEMAMIKTSEIQTFIQNQVSATSGQPYGFYIGLKEVGTSNTFMWNDNSELTYTNWNSGEPSSERSQPCGAMGWFNVYFLNLPWYDVNCAANSPTGFVCQRLIGLNLGSWESWGSRECQGIRQRNRTCVDSGRIGPNSCNDTATQSEICTPSASCNATMPLLTTTPTPPGRGNWFPNGTYEYYVSPAGRSRSYEDSKTFCKNSEGEFALIKNELTQGFIKTLISDESGVPYTFYIGLVYEKSKSMFQWNDGTNLSFSFWGEGEPNNHDTGSGTETCVSIGEQNTYDTDLLWHTMDCITGTGSKGLVCQRIIGKFWETWSSWSICNCSSMMKVRNRTCIDTGRAGPNICIGPNFDTANCSRDTACNRTSTAATVEMTTTNIYHGFTTPTYMTHTSTLSAIANNTKTTEINILFPTSAITTTTTADHNNLLVAIISSIVTLILAAILFGIGLLIRRCKVMRGNSQKIATQPQRLSEMNNVVNDVSSSNEKIDEIQTSQLNSGNYELGEEKEGYYEIPHNYEEIKDENHQYEEMNNSMTKEHPYINSVPESEYAA
ncbi:uncharacterized protein LOC144422857 [Styela clava]